MKWLTLGAILAPLPLFSLDLQYAPWFVNDKEFEFGTVYNFRYFDALKCKNGMITAFNGYSNQVGVFLNFTYQPHWFVYTQATAATTKHTEFTFDQWQGFVSYKWLDDIAGDPITLSAGLTIATGSGQAANDSSLFHSGAFELEFHTAFGKEWASGENWLYRTFLDLSAGLANRGMPWTKALFALEYNHRDCQTFSLLGKSWVGLGNKSIRKTLHRGYGSLSHRNIDLGLAHQFNGFCGGILGVEGYYGAYSYNYPNHPVQITLFWRYLFGI